MKAIVSCFSLVLAIALMSFTFGDGYSVGDKATDFSLKNVDNTFVSLSDFENAEGYILIFTCNTCPYAVMYEDRIQELHERHAANGYPVIAINPNDPEVKEGDSFDAMKVRSKEKGFGFPYLFDAGQAVFPQYGATKTPHVYILDKEMTVKYIGAIDDNPQDASSVDVKFVDDAVASLKAGKDPTPATTKAIGCSIKVKKA